MRSLVRPSQYLVADVYGPSKGLAVEVSAVTEWGEQLTRCSFLKDESRRVSSAARRARGRLD